MMDHPDRCTCQNHKGKVYLDPIQPYPAFWQDMLHIIDDIGKHFKGFSCRHNQTSSFASTGKGGLQLLVLCLQPLHLHVEVA